MKILHPFARWFRQFAPGTEVPDNAIFGSVAQRLAPRIYTDQEISDLLAPAHRLQPPLRGATYETLFGILVKLACGSPKRCICAMRTST